MRKWRKAKRRLRPGRESEEEKQKMIRRGAGIKMTKMRRLKTRNN
jgi:hypothetical protein